MVRVPAIFERKFMIGRCDTYFGVTLNVEYDTETHLMYVEEQLRYYMNHKDRLNVNEYVLKQLNDIDKMFNKINSIMKQHTRSYYRIDSEVKKYTIDDSMTIYDLDRPPYAIKWCSVDRKELHRVMFGGFIKCSTEEFWGNLTGSYYKDHERLCYCKSDETV